MQRGLIAWGWATSVLGAVIVLLMAGQVLSESLWLGKQINAVGRYSYMPLYVVGLVGVVLVIGGVVAAVSARHPRQ
ncbi:hypothetical protein BIU95_06990 [Curtobacterium sp. MCBA15_007]|uniref:hypothetical protein n=1 Tax=Curtobacterium TaxID=2034 RepID=UPI0005AC2AEB|nr:MULTISPECIES: hypothetical protein [Curtobacterium]KIQ07658.1 hypothetical protein RU06_10785 [Curtobacterium flaccumfaciens]OII01423.1 hypothetical protein BIU95_06990 [Curtobacterium sp. MCBA15_007]